MCLAVAVVSAVFLAGCGSPDLAESTGVVTLDGKPLGNAVVTFRLKGSAKDRPASAPAKSLGETDAAGAFRLATLINGSRHDGAVVGSHYASISDRVPEGAAPRFARLLLDSQEYVVRSGETNAFTIELSSKDLRRPNPLLVDD